MNKVSGSLPAEAAPLGNFLEQVASAFAPQQGPCHALANRWGCAERSPKPQARFVEHVNIPENTEILPGTEFTKIWRLRNTGDQPWPSNTRLVFTGGDKFAGDDYAEVAPAPAGSEVEVAISLTAPTECG